jgi:hypothetical protein
MKGPTEIIGLAWVRRMACALFVIQMTACSSWRVEQVSPAQLVTEKSPQEVRISRVGQAPLVVAKPTIVGDSLIGVAQGATHGVPLADIKTIATRQGSPLKSVLLGVAIAGTALAITVAVAAANCDCGVV